MLETGSRWASRPWRWRTGCGCGMIGGGPGRAPSRAVTEAGSVPMNPTFESNLTPPLRRVLAVLGITVALAACSRELSAQSTHAAASAPAAAGAAADPAAPPPLAAV